MFYLFCRALFARFMFFPSGKCKDKAWTFYRSTFVCELQILDFQRADCVQWSLGRNTSNPHGHGLETSEFGDSVVPKRGGFVTFLCVTACPRQPAPCVREWLVLVFSLSRVAELELFAL